MRRADIAERFMERSRDDWSSFYKDFRVDPFVNPEIICVAKCCFWTPVGDESST